MEKKQVMCIPFEYAPLNVKEYCVNHLRREITDGKDAFVLYKITETLPIPLGYIIIKKDNMPTNIVPWNDDSAGIISTYQQNKEYFASYQITHMYSPLGESYLLQAQEQMMRAFFKQGDFLWGKVRPERDLNIINNLGGFVRISSDIYLCQIDTQFLEQRETPNR